MAQDPQAYVDDQGNEYVREGNRWRVIRPGQSAAPQPGPQQGPIPGLIQMDTPAQRAQAEERAYDRRRDEVRDARLERTEERQAAAAERAVRTEERQIEQAARAGTPESRGRLATAIGPSVLAQDSLARQEVDASGRGVNPLNRDWGAALLDAVPDLGVLSPIARAWGGQDYQDYNQSLKTVEASLLPVFSGMAVTPQEAQRFIRANQPQVGDSPETLERKARNRQTILNEAATMLGRPMPYPEIGVYGEQGFRDRASQDAGGASGLPAPTVNDGRQVHRADDVLAVAPGEYAADYVAHFDRDGDNRASVEEMEAAGWTFDHSAGKWMPPAPGGGQPPAPPPAGPQGGAGGGIADLILGGDDQGNEGYRTAMEQGREDRDLLKNAGIEYGITDSLTGAFNDELAFGAGYLRQGLDNIGRQLTGREIEVSATDRARASRDLTVQDRDRFAREHPVQNFVGNALGGSTFGPQGAARTVAGRMGQGAGIGATYGMADADGSVVERLPSAAVGAGVGALAVPVIEKVGAPVINALARPVVQGAQSTGRFLGRQVGGAGNALGVPGSQRLVEASQPNPLASGLDRFARRSPQEADAMQGNALAFRAQEIEPTFADVVNDGGRGTLRALATRQTPARQAAREFADGRGAGLQDRISTQSRRTISDDPRSPTEIRTEVGARRTAEADQAFGAVRGEQIAPEREVIEALRAPAVKPAIEEAATAALNRGDSETANMLRQLADGALDNPNGVQITVGMADRLARSLNGRAEAFQRSGNNDSAGAYFALAERLRGSARQQIPGYDSALNAYAADSRLLSASELGEQFMSMEADQFAAAVSRLAPEEQEIARAAARRAVERQAGTQGQAPGVAQRLSNGREQAQRTHALIGDAAPVQQAMGAELTALRNAQGISPAQGSPTSMNAQDAMGAAGAARDVATGNVLGLAGRAMNAIRSRGFSDQEAQAIVTAAIDPAQTDRLVSMLAERMTRREARSLARALRYQITTNQQTSQ